MKILFRTMRYNWRYIFSKSNKIAVALFSVWGFVTLVTPTDIMLNCDIHIVVSDKEEKLGLMNLKML